MPQYLLSVFQEEGAEPPSPDEAETMMARVGAVQEEMKAAGVWIFFGAPDRCLVGHGRAGGGRR